MIRTSLRQVVLRTASFAAAAAFVLLASGVSAQRGGKKVEATTVDPAKAATIKGKVKIAEAPPKNRPISMNADPVCMAAHTDQPFEDTVLANDAGEIQEAFVFIASGLEGKAFEPSAEAAVIDQQGCIYKPGVLGVQVGQKLEIVNSDNTLHNVHALTPNGDVFNLAMPKQGMRIKQDVREACAMMHVKCDVHPWMSAWVGVLEHPYFDTTDANGDFEIPNLPAGTYTVTVFQRRLGWLSAELSIGEKQTAELAFEYTK